MTGTLEEAETEYLGKPSNASAKLAFFDVSPTTQIELIEPDREPSTWCHDLDQNDRRTAIKLANTRKCYWHIANSHILNVAVTDDRLQKAGYTFFLDVCKTKPHKIIDCGCYVVC